MNDREWIRDALQRHEAPLLLYAAKLCGGSERARDVVQETFLELCSAERSAVEPVLAQWLFTVCRNKGLDLHRKDETMKTTSDVDAGEGTGVELDPSSELVRGEERTRVLTLLARLPQKQQEALRLKFQGGLSYQEIASVMDTTAGNVGFLIHVALRALREKLAVEGRIAS